jgi:hypothetical protein
MKTRQPDSEDLLRLIDDLGADAEHSDEEARDALRDAGIDAVSFVSTVRDGVRPLLAGAGRHAEPRRSTLESRVRMLALGAVAASAVFFVVAFHVNSREGIAAQRQLARAQLIGPLLPALSSEDPERRSIALVVAREVDPVFASSAATQLTRWEVSSQAQARAYRNSAYATRILAGIQKLELSRDPNDRKVAIWNDLLPVLQEARRNRDEFVDVAIEYQRVLPLLRLRNPEVFLDSYWGELWILNILLDSKIVPVVEAARQQAPAPAVIEQVFQKHAAALPDRDRRAFEEAVSAYGTAVKALR